MRMENSSKPSAIVPAESRPYAASNPPTARWWRRWPYLALGLIVGGGLAYWLWRMPASQPVATPLTGKLIVYVRPPERQSEPLPIESPAATPVRAGGNMSLEVHLDPPGFVYFIWIDATGQVLPLYPWNSQHLEIKDIKEPPPERRPAKLVYSPLLGGGWNFGETNGAETVLLLARQTLLPKGIELATLLTPLPAAPTGEKRAVILGLDSGAKAVSVIHPAADAEPPIAIAADDPLAQLMLRLQPHFELIRAVRFAHE